MEFREKNFTVLELHGGVIKQCKRLRPAVCDNHKANLTKILFPPSIFYQHQCLLSKLIGSCLIFLVLNP